MIAPGRARRPGVGGARIEEQTAEELESCPFCEGREERTPPETLALPRRDPPDSPGWRVRVVPNLYPAFERQEVVVHSPRHVRSFAELDDDEIALVAEAWRERRAAVPDGYLHALINEGRLAGASLAHSHSQLVWMAAQPPGVTAEDDGAIAQLLARDELAVTERSDVRAVVHAVGRAPYEAVIATAVAPAADFLADALHVLAEVVRRLRVLEGPVPWNAWLHDGRHPHIELVPRLTVFAGVELGAGIYVNTLAPEDAAAALRSAAA